ncbi:hypothetical protein H9L13_10980 [Sphingomonas lutea]|uniref:Cellulose-binding protein n=1 Tax=Sphingomonas lutea TaxID=1045317 RepID=A0A7G9SH13_9SPHN|nr:hypothetical protein [Sphingomonas lutea]QNN67138.1 hypothetical protein H9L13_10980 [Sphingomonas lutea]
MPIWTTAAAVLTLSVSLGLAWTSVPGRKLTGAAIGGEPDSPNPSTPFRIGTNLDGVAYWSSALPFVDLMKSSGDWFVQAPYRWNTEEKVALDESGWPITIPRGRDGASRNIGLVVLREAGGADTPHTRYVVGYDGSGRLKGMDSQGMRTLKGSKPRQLIVETDAEGWVQLMITQTDPHGRGDFLRNIRVIREDLFPEYERGSVFNPAFVERIAPFRTIRFMDWMVTNSLFRADGSRAKWSSGQGWNANAAGELGWSSRPLPGDARWTSGVPVEIMVQLLNTTKADGWFNMPVNATDDYVRNFAKYVREHLDPKLNIHVELSNEVWNWAFPQAHYAKYRAESEDGKDANWMEWYGKRSAQVGEIWNAVFREPARGQGPPGRVRIVYSTQFAYKGLEKLGLETPRWLDKNGQHRRGADFFDEYAVTGYYGAGLSDDKQVAAVLQWQRDPDGGFQRALLALRKSIEQNNAPLYEYHAKRAREYGLELVTYESGFGERTPPSQHQNEDYTNFLIALQRRPEIYNLELANAEAFRRAGGSLFMNFGIIGKPSKWGSWSALEHINQKDSPRYRALISLTTKYNQDQKTRH